MQIRIIDELPREWLVDYGPARERAIRWLGDNYLLARAMRRPWLHAPLVGAKAVSGPTLSGRGRA